MGVYGRFFGAFWSEISLNNKISAGYSIIGGTVPAADLQPYIDLAISQVSTLSDVGS